MSLLRQLQGRLVVLLSVGGVMSLCSGYKAQTDASRYGIVIPFHFASPRVPFLIVAAKVNGKGPFNFQLDTGNLAAPLLLSTELASRLRIRVGGPVKHALTYGVSQSFRAVKVSSFEIEHLKMHPTTVYVAPYISEINRKLGIKVDGFIGPGLLTQYSVTLDFVRSTVGLLGKMNLGKEIPMERSNRGDLAVVRVKANGRPFNFAIDTGSSFCTISEEAAESLHLKRRGYVSLNGQSPAKKNVAYLDTLQVGNRQRTVFAVVVTDFLDRLNRDSRSEKIDGILGYTFLRSYRVTLDYPRRGVIMQENP